MESKLLAAQSMKHILHTKQLMAVIHPASMMMEVMRASLLHMTLAHGGLLIWEKRRMLPQLLCLIEIK